MTTKLPGRAEAYVLRPGEGLRHLVAGQIITTLASTAETGGAFGAVTCDARRDPRPIPLHWHEREHDTWFCTAGRLQVWRGEESRVLSPGDFAYVKPGDVHAYQSVDDRTQFFGIVAPGGWEEFFADAGEVWDEPELPPPGRPFDMARLGAAMGKHRIMRVDAPHAPETEGPLGRALPGSHASYFLGAPDGAASEPLRRTVLLGMAESDGALAMTLLEAGTAHEEKSPAGTTELLFVLGGTLELAFGGATHSLDAGCSACLPPGTDATLRAAAGARWIVATGR